MKNRLKIRNTIISALLITSMVFGSTDVLQVNAETAVDEAVETSFDLYGNGTVSQDDTISDGNTIFDGDTVSGGNTISSGDSVSDGDLNKEEKTDVVKEFMITYELNGGENAAENPASYDGGEAFELLSPTRLGYTFKGWYSNKKMTKKVKGIVETDQGNKTFYAKWAKDSYSITYVLNGGKNSSKNPSKYSVTSNTITLKEPTKKGYTFLGWYLDEGLSEAVTEIEQGSVGNLKLYAGWELAEYSITYVLNGGENNPENPESYNVHTPTFSLTNPTREGYTFKGWYSDKKFKNQVKKISVGSTKDKVLYAKWSATKYSIKYVLNGGKNSSKNPSKYYITTGDITFASPTMKGNTFLGWYRDADYSERIETLPQGSTGSLTLYAKWEETAFNITYVVDGGENNIENPSIYYMSGEKITLKDPTRENYVFSGWFKDKKFKKQVKTIKSGSVGDITLYAKWVPKKFTITYMLDGGKNSSVNPSKYSIESGEIFFKSPTKKGCTFNGWYEDAEFTVPISGLPPASTGDITIYAKWTEIEYTIEYVLNKGEIEEDANPTTYFVSTPTITLVNPTREGYNFKGWYKDSKFTKKITKITKGSTGNLKLYAKWEKKTVLKGIDVSHHNGVIDWNKVKASGIDFVIVRVGYRGASNGGIYADDRYKYNIEGAKAAGLKVGVYFFSQAINETEAVYEAQYMLDATKKYDLDFPIFIDTEDTYYDGGTPGRANSLTAKKRTTVLKSFCSTVTAGGRKAGVYASKSWFGSKFDDSALSNYSMWVAQWAPQCTYTGQYNFWQYSSTGSVPGINGNVDMDMYYER